MTENQLFATIRKKYIKGAYDKERKMRNFNKFTKKSGRPVNIVYKDGSVSCVSQSFAKHLVLTKQVKLEEEK